MTAGCVLLPGLAKPRMSLVTQHWRELPIRRRDAADPAGEDASVPLR